MDPLQMINGVMGPLWKYMANWGYNPAYGGDNL